MIKTGDVEPCIVTNEKGECVDAVPIHLRRYDGLKLKKYGTFNEALDEYYTELTFKKRAIKVAVEVDRELKKQQRVLQDQRKALRLD